jgi:aryl-alcohol dehydrogenase-like predicted oxidoreductase
VASLPARKLGKDGPEITRVGFGAWAIGGGGWSFGWGPQDDAESLATMRHALKRGINWIDTAAVYGLGHSEVLVGKLLRELPAGDRPYVFTKCGLEWDEKNRMGEIRRDLRPAKVRSGCETSLRRLGVERIDLFQFHWPDQTGTPVEDSWGEMRRLVEEGKVRWAGVSNFDVSLLARCGKLSHVDSLQPPFSMIRREVAASEIPWCGERDTWRRRFPEFLSPNAEKNLALRDALRPIAKRHGKTVEEVAVAWTLAWPGVTGAIVGARSPEQVDGWIGAAGLTFSGEDLEEIANAIDRTGAGAGPAKP